MRPALLLAFFLLAVAPAVVSADELKSLRAAYRLQLTFMPNTRIDGTSEVSSLRRCKDWVEQSHTSYAIKFNDRRETAVRYEARGVEAADGTRIDRWTQLTIDGEKTETRISGAVAAAGKGGTLQVVENGVPRDFELPDGVFLHGYGWGRVVAQLKTGQTVVPIQVFDAGYGPRVLNLLVNEVGALPSTEPPPFDPAGLARGRSWWVRVIHRSADRLQAPTTLRLHENGLIGFVRTTVSGVSVDFILASVEPLPEPGC